MATSKQSGSATARNASAPQRPVLFFPNGNYVLTPVFSSKESTELAKERLHKRQEERNFGFQ